MRPFVADREILMDNAVSLVRGSESGAAGGEGRSQGIELRLYWDCLAHCRNGGASAVRGASVELLLGWTLHNAGIEILLEVGFRVGGVRPAGCGWAAGVMWASRVLGVFSGLGDSDAVDFCIGWRVLVALPEGWRQQLGPKKVVGSVFVDLSNGFHWISHFLLIARLNAYGFDKNTFTLFFSLFEKQKTVSRLKPITAHF